MPKTHRDLLKRQIGYCIGNLDKVIEHSLEIRDDFLEYVQADPHDKNYLQLLEEEADHSTHARYVLLLEMAMLSALKTQELYQQFAEHAWGYVPETVERWTGTGQEYREKEEVS